MNASRPVVQSPQPTVLTIAGSDSCGGAGIQADLKAFTVLGVYGMSVVTAVTAQNTMGVQGAMELPLDLVEKQIQSVTEDLPVDAVKTGMLASVAMIDLVARAIRGMRCPYVCDPVMVAKSGDPLVAGDAVGELRTKLLPLATVITPNRHEVRRLLNRERAVETVEEAKEAAEALIKLGPKNVIIKGVEAGDGVVDVLFDGVRHTPLKAEKLPAGRSHGSGCTFSAVIAAELAKGRSVAEAAGLARQVITEAIRGSFALCRGTRPVNVMAWGRGGNDQ